MMRQHFHLAGGWRSIAVIIVAAVFASAAVAVTIQQPEVLTVDDPRPLNAAVALVEQRCHCAITYEDPMWRSDQVTDISALIWHRPDIRPRIPNGGRFTFEAGGDVSNYTSAQVGVLLERMLTTFDVSHSGPGDFQLIKDEAAFHVIPKSGSVLDARVTVAADRQTITDIIVATLKLVSDSSGQKVELATWPINLLKRQMNIEVHQEPAGVVLTRALSASGRKLSWRLFYSVGMAQYYLGVHLVP